MLWIVVFLYLFPTYSFTAGIEHIKNTLQILKPEKNHLSIAYGATAWETNIVRNYYELGFLQPRTKGQWIPNGGGPIQLTHALFTMINGNFAPSTNLSYPAAHLRATTIAKILSYLETIRTGTIVGNAEELEHLIVHEPGFSQSVTSTAEQKKNIDKIYEQEIKRITSSAGKTPSTEHIQLIKQLKEKRSEEISKLDTQRLCKALTLKETEQSLKQRLQYLQALTGKEKSKAQKEIHQIEVRGKTISTTKTDGDVNRVRELASAILKAHAADYHYPPDSAHSILLAFLYKNTKTSKDLWDYHTTLQQECGPEIFAKPLDQQMFTSCFAPSEREIIKQELREHECNPETFLTTMSPEQLEKFIYAQITERFYKGAHPKKAEYTNVTFQGHTYPDCVETTFRNLINHQLYNQQLGMFVPTDSMNPEVDAFYKHKTYKQTVNIEHPNTYQEWSHLLANRPWITYRSMRYITSAGTSLVVTSPPGTDGFIRGIPEHIIQQCQRDGNKICISSHWYELVESNEQQLFEVIPTFRNFIVCLNYLCNLHLYESEEDVFTHPTFNSTYFPELCKRLKPLQSLQLPKDLTMLDTHDYSADGIDFVGDKCTLIFKKNHSEYTAQETNKGLFDCAATIIKQTEHGDKKLIKLFPLFLTNSENICLKNMFPFVFGLDLHNHEEKIAALHHFFNEQHQFHNPDVKMIEFAAKLISALPIRLDWIYQIRVVHAIAPQLYDHPLIKPIIDYWKKIAYQRLAVETLEPDSPADFYTALAQHGHSLEEGINLARHINQNIVPTIKNPETKWLVEESALKLYHALAQQGLVKEEALSAAKNLLDAPVSREILSIMGVNPIKSVSRPIFAL